tara:strand:+ start:1121 stop:1930 length:810 start_codon:yes stop_codon:yes gene_type:complete
MSINKIIYMDNKFKFLENKKFNNKKLDNIYKFETKKYNVNNDNIKSELYDYIINIDNKNKNKKNISIINKNLNNLNNYEIIDIFNNKKYNIDKLLYSILYCIDSKISFLEIPLFMNEFKNYILYDISNNEFENKNKIIKNLENENINHNTLVFLSNYLNINIIIIRYNNFYKIISNENNNNIILVKNIKYYAIYNKNNNSYFIDNIDEIEENFKKYKNYDFSILKAISYYKIDELKEICLLFNINLLKENNKKKIKKEIYEELLLKIDK